MKKKIRTVIVQCRSLNFSASNEKWRRAMDFRRAVKKKRSKMCVKLEIVDKLKIAIRRDIEFVCEITCSYIGDRRHRQLQLNSYSISISFKFRTTNAAHSHTRARTARGVRCWFIDILHISRVPIHIASHKRWSTFIHRTAKMVVCLTFCWFWDLFIQRLDSRTRITSSSQRKRFKFGTCAEQTQRKSLHRTNKKK